MNVTSNNIIQILMVEDNLDEAELIQDMLKSISGPTFKITHKACLADTIDFLSNQKNLLGGIDVVLLDLHLPDGERYELFERISSHAPHLPIILLTNLDDEELASKMVRNGGQDYLLKSELNPKLLARTVRYAIERKQAKEALRESEERYTLVVQGTNDGIWDWNILTNKIYYSTRLAEIIQFQSEDLSDNLNEWFNRIHPADKKFVRTTLDRHLNGLTAYFKCEHRLLRKDNSYIWVLMRGLALRDEQNTTYRMAGSLTNINTQKENEVKLFHDAFHDDLTGLPNRALFIDRLMNAMERSKRSKSGGFAVLFIDLDRFKLINDSLGHMYGDQLLIKVADMMKTCLRSCDTAARLSGDEFAVLLEDIKDVSEATLIAERIQQAIQTPTKINQQKIVISASMGIILSDPRYSIPEDILRDADIAMYHAKQNGKACYSVFQQSMHMRSIMRMELENDLRELLDNKDTRQNNLYVVFQPIITSHNEQIIGFETLVRWKHPERGVIMPNEFIPLAEETGLIHSLGIWVLRQACKQVRIWQAKGLSKPGNPLSVSVNISGKQFSKPDLVDQIERIVREFRIAPETLNLEITERLLVEYDDSVLNSLGRLQSLGINLQIDDFGRGYSSFSYLQNIPVNTLKIDSLFIQRIGKNNKNSEIVRSIVGLAKSLGLSVIAEGVETGNQFQHLKRLNCPCVQGYYFSEAVRAEETEKMIIRNRHLNGFIKQNNKELSVQGTSL